MSIKIKFYKTVALLLCVCMSVFFCGCANKNVKAKLVKDAVLAESNYKLGDYMGDYTVTDVNGNSYTFSELLTEKKAIVLNFWYINCGPCQMEFPYLQSAYAKRDDIALIAINPVDEKEKDIKKFANEFSLDIPLAVGDSAWISAFSLQGFPTTIVIDRYGCIAFSHMGSITEEGVFDKIFNFFTDDAYQQTTIKNISDIK